MASNLRPTDKATLVTVAAVGAGYLATGLVGALAGAVLGGIYTRFTLSNSNTPAEPKDDTL